MDATALERRQRKGQRSGRGGQAAEGLEGGAYGPGADAEKDCPGKRVRCKAAVEQLRVQCGDYVGVDLGESLGQVAVHRRFEERHRHTR